MVKRKINRAGLELLQHFESLRLEAYQDSVGVWTIGWGHTGLSQGKQTVSAGQIITRDEAENC